MAAPERVRLKRKRHDDPLEALILTKADVSGPATSNDTPQKRIRYKLVDEPHSKATVLKRTDHSSRSTSPAKKTAHRLFHLRRWPLRPPQDQPDVSVQTSLPTFEERDATQQTPKGGIQRDDGSLVMDDAAFSSPTQLHKRPGKGSSLGHSKGVMQDVASHKARSAAEHQQNMQALADMLHQAALEDLARIPKPTSRAKPRMSPWQSKERHERNVAASRESSPLHDENAQMTDAGDFVYDTYVLAPADDHEDVTASSVGYLVIGKDDEDVWQSYMDEAEAAAEEDKDDDDENAESYYAADYPEDEEEDSEDDEPGEHVYTTKGGFNEEEWDHREEQWRDHEGDRSGTGVRDSTIIRKWEKILYGSPNDEET